MPGGGTDIPSALLEHDARIRETWAIWMNAMPSGRYFRIGTVGLIGKPNQRLVSFRGFSRFNLSANASAAPDADNLAPVTRWRMLLH